MEKASSVDLLVPWFPKWMEACPGNVIVEGSLTAISGSHGTLIGAPAEIAEYPQVHVEPPQPAEDEEPLSCCLCNGVVSSGQVIM